MIQRDPNKANLEFLNEKTIWQTSLELTYWTLMFEEVPPYTHYQTGKRLLSIKKIDSPSERRDY